MSIPIDYSTQIFVPREHSSFPKGTVVKASFEGRRVKGQLWSEDVKRNLICIVLENESKYWTDSNSVELW